MLVPKKAQIFIIFLFFSSPTSNFPLLHSLAFVWCSISVVILFQAAIYAKLPTTMQVSLPTDIFASSNAGIVSNNDACIINFRATTTKMAGYEVGSGYGNVANNGSISTAEKFVYKHHKQYKEGNTLHQSPSCSHH